MSAVLVDQQDRLLTPARASGFEPGVRDALDERAYRRVEALSYSGAKKLLRSPAHYLLERSQPAPTTDMMVFGSAVHLGVCEPERFDGEVLRQPADAPTRPTARQRGAKKPSDATLASIEWWDAFEREAVGRLVLTDEDYERARRCIAAVHGHAGARRLLGGARAEVSMQWIDGRHGVPCKARVDLLRADGGMVDLKTAQDASPQAFARSAANLLYHLQAAMYCSAAEHLLDASPPFWAWIAVESEPPHAVATYVIQSDALLAGVRLMDEAMVTYRQCLESGTWPGYAETIEPLNFPRYALTF